MTTDDTNGGWWQKHVLRTLERLEKAIDSIRDDYVTWNYLDDHRRAQSDIAVEQKAQARRLADLEAGVNWRILRWAAVCGGLAAAVVVAVFYWIGLLTTGGRVFP